MLITNLIIKQDKNGKAYKAITLENGIKLNVFSRHSRYEEIKIEENLDEKDLEKSGKFWNLKDISVRPQYERQTKTQQITQFQANKAEYIKQAQERTQEGIAWFNSTNSAISLLAARNSLNTMSDTEIQAAIRLWREWFLEEFKNKPPF